MKSKYISILLLFLLNFQLGKTQDTLVPLSLEMFYNIVKTNHPIAKQIYLLEDKGKNVVLREKGVFDPYLYSNLDQKYYSDKQYYNLFGSVLKIPTWYGIDFKLGYDQSTGQFLNAEDKLPAGGLVYAGVSMPLLQGLLINERRIIIKQAQVFKQSTVAEQNALLNDLMYEAIASYWEWYSAYAQTRVYENAAGLSQQRYQGVKQSFINGDRSAIDTLEAFLQYQNRLYNLNQAQILLQNTSYRLSNFLWTPNEEPLEITNKLIPQVNEKELENISNKADSLNINITNIAANHPQVLLYDFKLQAASLDLKWKLEKYKPKLNLNYNLLNEPIGNNLLTNMSVSNYKWGVEFSYPLFLRKERGDVKLGQIKVMEIEFSKQQKTLEQSNKIVNYKKELNILQGQRKLFSSMVINYETLLNAEKRNFETGESSLFLINAREMSLIDAQIKQIEVNAKFAKAWAGFNWSCAKIF